MQGSLAYWAAGLVTLAALLAGCAPPEYAKTGDPFRAATKADRPRSEAKVCFLVTGNTNKALEYINGLSSGAVGALGGIGGFDSKRVIFDLTSALQSRFRDAHRQHRRDSGARLQSRPVAGPEADHDPGTQKEGLGKNQRRIRRRQGSPARHDIGAGKGFDWK